MRHLLLIVCVFGFVASARCQTKEEKAETIAYLQKLQTSQGGFLIAIPKEETPATPTLQATSSAQRALRYFGVKTRNDDGTFGKDDDKARDTGGAAVVILRLGGKLEHQDNVLKAVRAGQRKDGAFGKAGSETSDLESTYRIMRLLHMLKEQPA